MNYNFYILLSEDLWLIVVSWTVPHLHCCFSTARDETLCANWYHLRNLRNLKSIYGGVFYYDCRVKPATLLKVILLHGCLVRNHVKHHKYLSVLVIKIFGPFIWIMNLKHATRECTFSRICSGAEVVLRRCSSELVLLKILQY